MTESPSFDSLSCPAPRTQHDHIVMGHGGGGRLMADLIQHAFLPELGNKILAALEDQATFSLDATLDHSGGAAARVDFTTDAFVVKLVFPDLDADGVANDVDNCETTYNPLQEDANGNGIGDACDVPSDGDLDDDGDTARIQIHLERLVIGDARDYGGLPDEQGHDEYGDRQADWPCKRPRMLSRNGQVSIANR